MAGIVVHKGNAAAMDRVNVDTDQIIPKQFLKRIERSGFGQFLFFDWRFNADGTDNSNFELNQPHNKNATILVANENFGCGSSREHAPWAIQDYGFQVVISPSFADIFYNNCVKNGILPIKLTETEVEELLAKADKGVYELTVDLKEQTVSDDQGFSAKFTIDPYWKEMLMNGWDEVSVTLNYEEDISEYEKQRA
ncbi:3-isopropylmalate dehydratase small subunit [Anaerobacillus alkalidiazotrophicus]|uniref:3-isopropylmalate dehydratase small subunit n=1 Tax=Anaerobacillus alkalidiazotrophicus TaxID=472963 RepID=A0A1S2M500_9BACI|nr:3-isopropylmalate dehydratase small subunit [Anaerobacillus alkalidiazotrophicus]OIJ18340.1 3-isopropylmalate dehydratase small subunit [Anaerobacillus alkalidiazotrophicus]OIJ19819.1 3-isopropylmalate dehydratase small subunit [Anaerobacillus alkalidiazotrophicus]